MWVARSAFSMPRLFTFVQKWKRRRLHDLQSPEDRRPLRPVAHHPQHGLDSGIVQAMPEHLPRHRRYFPPPLRREGQENEQRVPVFLPHLEGCGFGFLNAENFIRKIGGSAEGLERIG